jgi:hypothetical protein
MTRLSNSRVTLGGVSMSAALLVLSGITARPAVRGGLVLAGCAGIGAAVTSLQTGSAWRRVSHGVLAVEGAFFAALLAWAGYWIASHGNILVLPRIIVPYVAVVAIHHAALALAGGLAAIAVPPAMRRIRVVARPAHLDANV